MSLVRRQLQNTDKARCDHCGRVPRHPVIIQGERVGEESSECVFLCYHCARRLMVVLREFFNSRLTINMSEI